MFKLNKMILALLVLCSFILIQPSEGVALESSKKLSSSAVKKYAYRNTYFGDSKTTVKKVIKSKYVGEDNGMLYYKTKALNKPCTLVFAFTKGKLSSVLVSFDQLAKYDTWGKKIRLHNDLNNKLRKELNTKSYGFTKEYDYKYQITTLYSTKNRSVLLSVSEDEDYYYEPRASIFYIASYR